MPETIADNSVGIVKTQFIHFSEALILECGKTLAEYDIAYETYGELNADASNAILICHALSGDQHAAGYHSMQDKKAGWWESAIGPGKPIDTNRFFVVSINNLGGCKGSSGPNTINPETGKYWGPDFPIVTVKDWVLCQYRFMKSLNISHWCAVIGGSLILDDISTLYTNSVAVDSIEQSGTMTVPLLLLAPSLKIAPGQTNLITVDYVIQKRLP